MRPSPACHIYRPIPPPEHVALIIRLVQSGQSGHAPTGQPIVSRVPLWSCQSRRFKEGPFKGVLSDFEAK